MEATANKGRSLAGLKRRIKLGTRLLCVENTLRPVLNGTYRTVTRVLTVAFTWKQDGDGDPRDSWTHYPKAAGLTWVDDDTFRLSLGRSTATGTEHYVELRFLPDPAAN